MIKNALFSILLMLTLQAAGQDNQFTGQYLYQTETSRVFAVGSGDLDNDGLQDIVFTEPDQPVLHWMKNSGSGTFILGQVWDFPAIGVQVTDMDADGLQDIIACSYDKNCVVWFRNLGNALFDMDTVSTALQHPLVVSAGDIDGDGDMDISAATQDAGTGVILLVNDGNMNFTPVQMDSQPYSSTWTQITDLDLDGTPDIVGVWFNNAGGIIWYRQTSPLVFERHFLPCPAVHGAAVGDVDGDGDQDMAAATCGNNLAWFENDGACNFTIHTLSDAYNCAVSVGIADIDLDFKNDIAVTVYGSKRIDWWKNEGNNTFTKNLICDTLLNPSDLRIDDINGDDIPDVLTGSYKKKLAYFENTAAGMGTGKKETKSPFRICTDLNSGTIGIRPDASMKGSVTVEIYNSNGRLIHLREFSSPCPEQSFRTGSDGLYILRISCSGSTWNTRVLMP